MLEHKKYYKLILIAGLLQLNSFKLKQIDLDLLDNELSILITKRYQILQNPIFNYSQFNEKQQNSIVELYLHKKYENFL